jgi:hypothetical protein
MHASWTTTTEIISDEANAINRMEVETLKRSMRDPRAPPIFYVLGAN